MQDQKQLRASVWRVVKAGHGLPKKAIWELLLYIAILSILQIVYQPEFGAVYLKALNLIPSGKGSLCIKYL